MGPMTSRRTWFTVVVLLSALGLAACGSTDETADPTDGSSPLESTDDSLGDPLGGQDGVELVPETVPPVTGADGSTSTMPEGEGASAEVCEALTDAPNPDQVELFPEELQDDAADYIEAIEDFEELGGDSELPEMSAELAAFVSTCR